MNLLFSCRKKTEKAEKEKKSITNRLATDLFSYKPYGTAHDKKTHVFIQSWRQSTRRGLELNNRGGRKWTERLLKLERAKRIHIQICLFQQDTLTEYNRETK